MLAYWCSFFAFGRFVLQAEAEVEFSLSGGNASVSSDAAADPAADLAGLLPDNVQHVLSGLLAKHGHPENTLDADASALMHLLVPEAQDADALVIEGDSDVTTVVDVQETKLETVASAGSDTEQALRQVVSEQSSSSSRPQEAEAVDKQEVSELGSQHDQHADEHQHRIEQLEATRRSHDEYLQKTREKAAARAAKHAEMMNRHANMGRHVEELLMKVHSQLEADTHGFQDVPFWDDFFQNTSTRSHWGQLSVEMLKPALGTASWATHHRVLVLEPSASLGLAERLAGSLREASAAGVVSHTYGTEPNGEFDIILELGLLDAVAMGGNSGSTSRLSQLRRASARLTELLRPGGAWISVSAVPPALRLPLIERLSNGALLLPAADNVAGSVDLPQPGMHTIKLSSEKAAKTDDASERTGAPRLRGAASPDADSQAQRVANLLLYGKRDPHVFAYRIHRRADELGHEGSNDSSSDAAELESLVAAQRPDDSDEL
eukprot:TRINITY_DN100800_c0_g1_i1.p1 TRINITY_DN100800_c0_g1~~TRINITY_DN100800_c0_g1_i1.p1  ORF type:complete len:492 (+),score=91.33 TRINITY_DN100800_c0_g1_i1:87-1562(+)